jgi:hypothetical protein
VVFTKSRRSIISPLDEFATCIILGRGPCVNDYMK